MKLQSKFNSYVRECWLVKKSICCFSQIALEIALFRLLTNELLPVDMLVQSLGEKDADLGTEH
jgi:hypothetical protein